jgi:uncharacterized protein (TIGR02452 family)
LGRWQKYKGGVKKMKRIAIARDTIDILEAGYYKSASGDRVDLTQALKFCFDGTTYYEPDILSKIEREVLSSTPQFSTTEFEVKNETTLMGSERIAKTQKFQKIGVLNFASARNPGGGFLNGSQAQEESIARSSALYKSLLRCPDYYHFHRSYHSLLYSDRMIYSPNCPVFKNDDGNLLEQFYVVDFITSPAPNAGMIRKNQPQDAEKIYEVLKIRGSKLLSLAAYHGCDVLILGAWGCGVFQNEPSMVARMFADFLLTKSQYSGRFKSVIFSVLDTSKQQKIFPEFQKRFFKKF